MDEDQTDLWWYGDPWLPRSRGHEHLHPQAYGPEGVHHPGPIFPHPSLARQTAEDILVRQLRVDLEAWDKTD